MLNQNISQINRLNDLDSIQYLIKLTQSKNGNERRLAASSLGKLSKINPNINEAVPSLIKLLEDDKPQVRQYAINALSKMGDSRAIAPIKKLLYDDKYYVINSAKSALSKLKNSDIDINESIIDSEEPKHYKMEQKPKKEIFTVANITSHIKQLLESDKLLSNLLVRGEISNISSHGSGHTYFTLKDEKSQIRCILFSRDKYNVNFKLEHGMKIIVGGDIEVYKVRGDYSIIVREVHPDGPGSLNLAFNQLKDKLKQEGLFLESNKKIIPKFPKTIGIITSPTGAVIKDVLNIIERRYPIVNILVAPTLVQGDEAINQIINSIKIMNEHSDIDAIILCRGGGPLEDLWCFNNESVARAIFESDIPIISAIGHETDFTITDFVADYRAPTPSAAAEKIVPDVQDLYHNINHLKIRGSKTLNYKLELCKSKLKQLTSKHILKKPIENIHTNYREIDEISYKLKKSIINIINNRKNDIEIIESKIHSLSPKNLLELYNQELKGILNSFIFKNPTRFIEYNHKELENYSNNLHNIHKKIIEQKNNKLKILKSKIIALNPKAILERGYSIVMKKNKIITNSSDLKKREDINIVLYRGNVDAKVKKTNK